MPTDCLSTRCNAWPSTPKGTVYAGTQCHGLAVCVPVAVPANDPPTASGAHDVGKAGMTLEYRTWRVFCPGLA